MILGTKLIHDRLLDGEIFRKNTWREDSIMEASYALRIANDGMVVDGKVFQPGEKYPEPHIEIKPGRIAILSTIERLCMPHDLVGKLGVRLDFASKGITGLMGIQVDPYYGSNHEAERLFIKVANFGSESIRVVPGDEVFNIEFSVVRGASNPKKTPTWDRIMKSLAEQRQFDWTYVARVEDTFEARTRGLGRQLDQGVQGIRDNQQAVVLFGVFLVAVTLLAALVGVIVSVENAPSWLVSGGWIVLIVLCALSTAGILTFLIFAGVGFWMSTKKQYRPLNLGSSSTDSVLTEDRDE